MKDIRTETRDTVPDTFTRLSSPHFDELAVAVAQPVQPLPPRRKKRLLRSSLWLIAYLAFIVAVVGIAYLKPPGPREDALSEATTNETESDVQSGVVDGSPAATTENESTPAPVSKRVTPHSSRSSTRVRVRTQTIQIVESGEGKPVPRKVGEIRYGRSSDRP